MLMKGIMFLLAFSLCGASLSADEVIFKFNKGKIFGNASLAEDKQGYTMEKSAEGLLVKFQKYEKGNSSWPCLNINPSELKTTDWKKYGSLVITVRNLSPDTAAMLAVTIRQNTWRQMIVTSRRIRENSLNHLVIPLEQVAEKVDLSKIGMLQVALSKPPREVNLEFISLSLSGEPRSAVLNKPALRSYDLREDILSGKKGIILIPGTKLTVTPEKEVIVEFEKYGVGKDQWPGLEICGRVDGALNDGSFDLMTHLVCELEEIGGMGSSSLGLSFEDTERKSLWSGIGSLKGGQFKLDREIRNMGVDLANIAKLRIGTSRPEQPFRIKINKLMFEFRPELLYQRAQKEFGKLNMRKVASDDRKLVDSSRSQLELLYRKIQDGAATSRDVRDFIALSDSIRQMASQILRRTSFRELKQTMPGLEYSVGIADSMTSVFLEEKGFSVSPAKKAVVQLAGNENESFQVVVVGDQKKLERVRVGISDLTGPRGKKLSAKTALVGHARTQQPLYPVEYVGWYPDFLIEYQNEADVKPGEAVPFWIRLKAPADAPAGIYKGKVTVSAANSGSYEFPVEAEVFNFSLPDGSPLPSSNNFNLNAMRKTYKIRSETEWQEFLTRMVDLAADYKISLDFLYYGPYTSLKGKGYYPLFKRLNDRGLLRSYCILNTTVPDKSVYDPNHPEVDKLIERSRRHLDYWGDVAKEFGVRDKAYLYGFDEGRVDAVTNRVFGFVKKNYPDLPIMTTAGIPDADIPGLENIDIWVPQATTYVKKPELVDALRKKNKKVWWYVCNFPRPPEPTLMLEVPACVPRLLMGMMSAKYKPDGFLYYSLVIWKQAPVDEGPRTAWNPATYATDNEDGNLFVPGRNRQVLPTIRIENFRDGVEDLWYYTLLRQSLEQAKTGGKNVPTDLMKAAKAALSVPDSIVGNTGDYTTDPALIRAERLKIARLIEAFRKSESDSRL